MCPINRIQRTLSVESNPLVWDLTNNYFHADENTTKLYRDTHLFPTSSPVTWLPSTIVNDPTPWRWKQTWYLYWISIPILHNFFSFALYLYLAVLGFWESLVPWQSHRSNKHEQLLKLLVRGHPITCITNTEVQLTKDLSKPSLPQGNQI